MRYIHIMRVNNTDWGIMFWGVCLMEHYPENGDEPEARIIVEKLEGHYRHDQAMQCAARWSEFYRVPIFNQGV